MSLCTLGVHKARSEWFIYQWCSVPSCRALSLPSPWRISAARWKQGGGERVSFALWPALVPVCPRVALGDEKGCEAGDVFCSPPDRGDIAGPQPGPQHRSDGQGRPFPGRIPGSSQGTARISPLSSALIPFRPCPLLLPGEAAGVRDRLLRFGLNRGALTLGSSSLCLRWR